MTYIYCCGGFGNVGFVREWTFDQTDRSKVTGVTLTLDPGKAHAFYQDDMHASEIRPVMRFLRERRKSYGTVTELSKDLLVR